MRLFISTLFIFISSLVFATDFTVETIPNVQVADSNAFVSNPDGILSAGTTARLDEMISGLRKTNTAEMAVVVVKSIGDRDIKSFATDLFEYWKIGRKEKDNGLLILFVENQRKITFETGYGVEGVLPDAICKRIQVQDMLPYFKQGNYDEGMVQGVQRVITRLTTDEANDELLVAPDSENADIKQMLIYYLIAASGLSLVFVLLIRGALKNAHKNDLYGQYRSLSGFRAPLLLFSFIFPVFVLFLYIWVRTKLHRLRDGKRICPDCGMPMRKLTEQEEDIYLTPQEQTEERLKSVDYDVWLCPQCKRTKIYPYENAYTRYSTCPHCKSKTYALESDRIISHPTSISTGMGQKNYRCQHCQHTDIKRYVIPMIIIASGGGRRGGGFGGGGFSGGGGFGGGRSGGGGSTSGW